MTNMIFTSHLELEKNAKVGKLKDNTEIVFFSSDKSPNIKTIFSLPEDVNDDYTKQIFRCFNKNKIDQICRKIRDKYLFEKKVYLQTYFYNTKNFLLKASKSKDVKRFQKKYNYKILSTYDKDKAYELYNKWARILTGKGKQVVPDTELDFFFDPQNIKKYKIRFLFLEVDGQLVGVKIAHPFLVRSKKTLILRYQFSLYEYYGINQFMTYELMKREKDFKEFSDGGEYVGEQCEGRRKYKMSRRRPERIEDIYKLEITKRIL
jgi:hypothetical protein